MTRRFRPDPKEPRRLFDVTAGYVKLRREGRCRVCRRRPGEPIYRRAPDGRLRRVGTVPALSRHHLVPRSQGGDDVDANLVPVCGDGARGCHGHLENRTPGYREQLRRHLHEAETGYVIGKKGEAWLDRHYPLEPPAT